MLRWGGTLLVTTPNQARLAVALEALRGRPLESGSTRAPITCASSRARTLRERAAGGRLRATSDVRAEGGSAAGAPGAARGRALTRPPALLAAAGWSARALRGPWPWPWPWRGPSPWRAPWPSPRPSPWPRPGRGGRPRGRPPWRPASAGRGRAPGWTVRIAPALSPRRSSKFARRTQAAGAAGLELDRALVVGVRGVAGARRSRRSR